MPEGIKIEQQREKRRKNAKEGAWASSFSFSISKAVGFFREGANSGLTVFHKSDRIIAETKYYEALMLCANTYTFLEVNCEEVR